MPQFVAWHDVTSAQQKTESDKFAALGYRFISLSIYGDPSAPLYASVMLKRDIVVAQYAQWDLSAAGFQTAFDSWAAKGFGPVIISATGPSQAPLFAAVWQPMSPIPLTRYGLTGNELAALTNSCRFDTKGNLLAPSTSTTMPRSLDVYGGPGDRRYAVVLVPNPDLIGWNASGIDETAAEYQARFGAQTAGWGRPAIVSPTGDGNYASVFRDDQIGPWVSRHDMTSADYQQAYNDLVAQGYFPLHVQGGGSGDARRFAAIFAKTETTTPRAFTPAPAADAYDTAMQGIMKTYGVRQAALALVQGTRLVVARAYTYAEPGYPLAQPTTLFRQASCSKTITAILLHQLIREGALSLNDTLVSILNPTQPDGSAPKDPRFAQITVQHLLEHSAGIPGTSEEAIISLFPNASLPITEAQLRSWAAAQTLTGTPGTFPAWHYSNEGYSLLGQIVAQKRNCSYIEAVNAHVCTPLGLQHTRLAIGPVSDQLPGEAHYTSFAMNVGPSTMAPSQPMVPQEYGDRNMTVYAGAGGISASVIDMARILAALNLTAGTNPLLHPDEIDAMFQAATKTMVDTLNDDVGETTADKGMSQGLQSHGWDVAWAEAGGGWYGQKGGYLNDAQSGIRHSTTGICMAVAWAHTPTGGDWYPDFPEVINAAASTDWGTTDLFPSYGMASFNALEIVQSPSGSGSLSVDPNSPVGIGNAGSIIGVHDVPPVLPGVVADQPGVVNPMPARSATPSTQDNWRYCQSCAGLFFAGFNQGVCPGAREHDPSRSGDYVLTTFVRGATGQPDWRWCEKCQGLFFAQNGNGVCPAGGEHDGTTSWIYVLHDGGRGQPEWRWCNQCQGLFFSGNGAGVCPAGGGHDGSGTSGAGYTL